MEVSELVLHEADARVPVPHVTANGQEAEQQIGAAQLAPAQKKIGLCCITTYSSIGVFA